MSLEYSSNRRFRNAVDVLAFSHPDHAVWRNPSDDDKHVRGRVLNTGEGIRMRGQTFIAAIMASAGLVAGNAYAADVAPVMNYDWTGFYIGAQAGYGWGNTEYSYPGDPSPPPGSPFNGNPVGLDYDGMVGGGTLGYNWQHDSIVLGVEADLSLSGMSDDKTENSAPCFEQGCSADVNWFGTGRLRLGYAIDSIMPFVTGGVAAAGLEGEADNGACEDGPGDDCGFDETEWGWTVGGGIEWGFADNWSAKAEYLYVNVGSPEFSASGSDQASADDFDFSVVRVGLNYRFY